MKIIHCNGPETDTDALPDVDALLMEESQKLQSLFGKYDRQLFLVGDMKHKQGSTLFFHIGRTGIKENPEEFLQALVSFWAMVDGVIQSFSHDSLCIKDKTPPAIPPES